MTKIPTVGFISLGCPKALVDSERILTQLRSEGYNISPTYQEADLVIVNTCGFIDAAVEESLDSIGEALAENGKKDCRITIDGAFWDDATEQKQHGKSDYARLRRNSDERTPHQRLCSLSCTTWTRN